MTGLSFRTKLTLLNALVVLVSLLGIGFGLIYTTQTAVMRSLDGDMLARSRQLTRNVPPALGGPGFQGQQGFGGPGSLGGPGGPPGQNMPPAQERRNQPPVDDLPAVERPLFFGAQGNPVAPNPNVGPLDPTSLRVQSGPPILTTVELEGGRTRVLSQAIVRDGQFLGTMQFGRSLEEFERLVATQTRLLLILIPLALIVATLAGSFLANRALKPVMEVTDAAAHISESDLARRLDVRGTDELAQLALTFNQMVERLQLSFEQRERLLNELQDSLAKQRQFVADASHELRTPLARMKLTTSSALSQEGDEGELRESLKIADEAADGMSRLVQQLLVLARADAQESTLPVGPVLVREAIDEAVEQFDPKSGATIRSRVEDESLAICANKEDIVRCLVNLLGNARRYTSATGLITVTAKARGNEGILSVEDDGAGIPAEHVDKVTERFYRVDEARSRKDGGCGLGLAICKSIVEGYGGELKITSDVGKGTLVEMRFPMDASSKSDDSK
ncbi:MAG: HAMP domain-containing histidine kinase [Fimbriimonadaceae bacterium]|nr:HAMP domain-containing histidine kinase [Fimbriimonadaceae bacterium]